MLNNVSKGAPSVFRVQKVTILFRNECVSSIARNLDISRASTILPKGRFQAKFTSCDFHLALQKSWIFDFKSILDMRGITDTDILYYIQSVLNDNMA